jgi:hypothetical protein
MARKFRYTVEQVLEALNACNGLVYLAAEKLGCCSQTICNYQNRHARIRQVVLEKRGRRVDVAEAALDKAILNGEGWAIRFLLSTQGRDRGYQPALQLEGGERPLEVKLVREDDFYRNRDRLERLEQLAENNGEAP